MDGISRSRGRDKEIPHCVLPMEQLVLSDKWARKRYCSDPDKTKAIHTALADFFAGTWSKGNTISRVFFDYIEDLT